MISYAINKLLLVNFFNLRHDHYLQWYQHQIYQENHQGKINLVHNAAASHVVTYTSNLSLFYLAAHAHELLVWTPPQKNTCTLISLMQTWSFQKNGSSGKKEHGTLISLYLSHEAWLLLYWVPFSLCLRVEDYFLQTQLWTPPHNYKINSLKYILQPPLCYLIL